MSLIASLCAALERVGGERLVMRAGERPHVLAGDRRHDVANAVLSVTAVEALADQILSPAGRQELTQTGSAVEAMPSTSFPHPLTARAERVENEFCIELIVSAEVPSTPSAPAPAPEAIVEDSVPVAEASADVPVPPAENPQPIQDDTPPVRVVTRFEEPTQVQPRIHMERRGDFTDWIRLAAERGATALYLHAGVPPAVRVNDRIEPLGMNPVGASLFDALAASFNRGGDGEWHQGNDGEWIREEDDLGRVTCRTFVDHQGTGVVVQLQPRLRSSALHAYIPRQIRLACEADGLIVVSAPTTTELEPMVAALADWSGRRRGGYLISLQQHSGTPVQVTGGFVSHRTVTGSDAEFAAAVRRASQERPDILVVIATPQASVAMHEAVVAASSGGQLAIVAVTAPTTVDGLKAILGPGGERNAATRQALAAAFRGGFGYRTLRRLGGGRTVIQDVLIESGEVRSLLNAGNFDGLMGVQQRSAEGNRSTDHALARAIRRGHVSLRQGAAHAIDRRDLVALVRKRGSDRRGPQSNGGDHAARHATMRTDDRLLQGMGAGAGSGRDRSY